MSEKEIFDLMDELEELDIEQLMIADELDEEILNRIKAKTRIKLHQEMDTILPFKRKRLTRKLKVAAAIIILAVLVPASVSALNTIYYHYVPGAGEVIISGEEILCLDKPQKIIVPPVYDDLVKDKIRVAGGVATLTNVQITDKNTIMTTVELVFPEENRDLMLGLTVSKQGTLIVNGEKFLSDDFRGSGLSINLTFRHEFKNLPEISLEDDLVYQFELYDGTIYEYAITLEKAQGEITYEDLGPTAIQHDLPITAVIEEDKDMISVNFITPLHPNRQIKTFGTAGCIDECLDPFVTLIDANFKKVFGKKVYHNNRDNSYIFDVSELTKPYTIVLSNVTAMYYYDESFSDFFYTIKVPKMNETFTEVEPIIIKDYVVPVTSITLTDVGKETRGQIGILDIELDMTREYINGKRLIGISMWDNNPLWFLRTYNSMSSQNSEDNFQDNMGIPLHRRVKEIKADITGIDVQLQGNWEFVVE